MERTLMEVSDPSHARYGQHLKRDELKDLIKPRAESTNVVLSWLEQSGIESRNVENDGEWINFHAPVERAESMMGTSFKVYQNAVRPGVKRIRSLSYSVPKAVRDHIDMIQPTTRFGQIRSEGSSVLTQEAAPFSVASVDATCNNTITPDCLRNLYNFADYNVSTKAAVKLGITGYLEQYARYADLNQFTKKFSPFAIGSNFSFTSVNGMYIMVNEIFVPTLKFDRRPASPKLFRL
jgi:tripeptidyl-peptidase-1